MQSMKMSRNLVRSIRRYSTATGLKDVFIVSAARTPIGSFRGSLSQVPTTRLGAIAVKGVLDRVNLPATEVNEVYFGIGLPGSTGQAPVKQIALGAGLTTSVPCTHINKVCASGLKSVMMAAQNIMCGHQQIMVAGGAESMSNVPFYMARTDPAYGGVKLEDGILKDGLTDAFDKIHMGVCGEMTATKYNITREDQDEYAKMSYKRVIAAAESGVMKTEIVPVHIPQKRGPEVIIAEDEEYKKVNFDKFATLRPAFDKNGTITAANASKLNDGGCAVLLMTEEAMKKHNLKPLARIVAFADAALPPVEFTTAPAASVPKVLKMAGLTKDDIAMWEINEAFSVVSLVNVKLMDLDMDKVNVHGGAVSIGHPIGMSGARILTHMVHNLKSGEKGLASICNGGGGASAMIIERV